MSAVAPVRIDAQRRLGILLKIGAICLLVGLLLIPLGMIGGLLADRQSFQKEAVESISSVWGHQQLICGPVLAVPYAYKHTVVRDKYVDGHLTQVDVVELVDATAYFLPDSLTITGKVTPEIRQRGIYDAVVYNTRLELAGDLNPDFAAAGIEAERIDWDKARVYLGVSDLRGIRSVGVFKVAGQKEAAFDSSDGVPGAFLPLAAKLDSVKPGTAFPFTLEVIVQGSKRLDFAPVGKTTSITLQSPWPTPSFVGASLPFERSLDAAGFRANWQSSHLSHGFPQNWTNRTATNQDIANKISDASFGVRFTTPVDGYGMVERARKYGVLFFVLIFAVFFVFEIVAGLRIHPLQYALVGAALCLFFIGFLALSEFWTTGWAYAVAAVACTVLVSLYSWNFLRARDRTLVIAGGLSATYGYLYFVLQSQDYALLAGTLALFAVLALVMFCTRRIDWYALDPGTHATPEPPKLS